MSKFGNFLISTTNIEKFIGIARATMFPNKDPVEIESPTMMVTPPIAKIIEIKLISEIFSFKKK